jgi:hypothetical protein
MISGARPGSIPGAQLDPSPELEVLCRHEPLALRRYGLCQVPYQELLSHRRGGEPDARLYRGIEIGELRPKSCLPNVLFHSDLLALPLRPEKADLVPVPSLHVMRSEAVPRKSVTTMVLRAYHIALLRANFSHLGAVAKW